MPGLCQGSGSFCSLFLTFVRGACCYALEVFPVLRRTRVPFLPEVLFFPLLRLRRTAAPWPMRPVWARPRCLQVPRALLWLVVAFFFLLFPMIPVLAAGVVGISCSPSLRGARSTLHGAADGTIQPSSGGFVLLRMVEAGSSPSNFELDPAAVFVESCPVCSRDFSLRICLGMGRSLSLLSLANSSLIRSVPTPILQPSCAHDATCACRFQYIKFALL